MRGLNFLKKGLLKREAVGGKRLAGSGWREAVGGGAVGGKAVSGKCQGPATNHFPAHCLQKKHHRRGDVL